MILHETARTRRGMQICMRSFIIQSHGLRETHPAVVFSCILHPRPPPPPPPGGGPYVSPLTPNNRRVHSVLVRSQQSFLAQGFTSHDHVAGLSALPPLLSPSMPIKCSWPNAVQFQPIHLEAGR